MLPMRRIIVSILLAALLCTAAGAYVQARRTDAASDQGWADDAGPPQRVVGTPILSVRRAPAWLSAPITEARLSERLAAVVASSSARAHTCLTAYRNGSLIASEQGDAPLVPSSLMKIVTAAAILETAGPAAVYSTEVFVRSDSLAAAAEGVLTGDIYLVGRGDPVLSTPAYSQRFAETKARTDFTELVFEVAAALRQRGITQIEGSVVADESRFPEEERNYSSQLPDPGGLPVWEQSYINDNEVGPLSALLLNDGYISFSPSVDYASRRQNVRAEDPARHAAEVLDGMLEARGIAVTGEAGKGVAPALAERSSLGAVESPPMAEIVTRMLRHSDNTTAEMLLKEIGRRSSGSARAQAVLGVHDVLQRQFGLPTDGMIISDGSGLSLQNRLTCDLIAELLRRAGPDSPLVRGMAVVGENGALLDCRIDPVPPAGAVDGGSGDGGNGALRVWAQIGTLDDVSALAGVTVADNGDVITFAMISNGEGLASDSGFCNDLQRGLMVAAADHPYGPSAADPVLHPVPAVAAPAAAPAGAEVGG